MRATRRVRDRGGRGNGLEVGGGIRENREDSGLRKNLDNLWKKIGLRKTLEWLATEPCMESRKRESNKTAPFTKDVSLINRR